MSVPAGEAQNREIIRRLTERLITGGMTSEEFEYFESILMEDADARQTYIEHLQVHSHLNYLEKAEKAIEDEAFSVERAPSRHRITKLGIAAGLLAGCVMAVGLFMAKGVLWQPVRALLARVQQGDDDSHRAPVIGEGVFGVLPHASSADSQVRTPLRANQVLEFHAGVSRFRLQNGVLCVVEGPAKVQLRSPSEAFLEYGRFIARVPESAVGFRVDTPHGQIVDLGTTFGVSTFEERQSYVQVFSGAVAVRSQKWDPQGLPLLVRAGSGAKFNSESAPVPVEELEDLRQFSGGMMALDGILHVAGEVQFLSEPPASVRAHQLQSDEWIYLFHERNDVVLRNPLKVISPAPQTISRSTSFEEIELPPGTRCQSILIHSDLQGQDRPLTGTIRFDRPLIGLIVSTDGLQGSDAFAGSPFTEYPTDEDVIAPGNLSRGTATPWKSSKEAIDSITVHEDRRGVTVTMQAPGNNIDQIRILLQAEDVSF